MAGLTGWKKFAASLAAAILFCIGGNVEGQTWLLSDDFSIGSNPSGAWAYYLEDVPNGTFAPLDTNTRNALQIWGTAFAAPPTMWSEAAGYWAIGRNDSGATQTAGSVTWNPGEVFLHPRYEGDINIPQRIAVGWQATQAMTIDIDSIYSSASNAGNGVGLSILHRSGAVDTELLAFNNSGLGATANSISNLNVTAGDTVYFRYDAWADAGGDITRGDIRITAQPANAIFSENFNDFTNGIFNGGQFESNLDLAHSGDLPGWSKSGGGTVHAVDHANVTGNIVNPRDFAPMIWEDNVITLGSAIADSNTSGQLYDVDFLASAAVYQAGNQQTSATDGLLFEVLRADDSVLASYEYLPGEWTGDTDFSPGSFQYLGDGTGDIRLRIGPSAFGSGRFGGAIDNLTLSLAADSLAVPEPSSLIVMSFIMLIGLIGCRWCRQKVN